MAVRQLQNFFREIFFASRFVAGTKFVGQKIIRFKNSGGVHESDTGNLNVRRPVRKNSEPVVACMPGKVEQNINFIGANKFRRVLIVEVGNVAPGVGKIFYVLRD